MASAKKQLLDSFNVCIKVIEAKDLPDANISSLVRIQVGNQKKDTRVIKNTNKPYFDEYFVFEIYSNFDNLLSTIVNISISKPRNKFKFKKLIGSISFDVGLVWSQPNQRLQNWMPVTVPSDATAQVKGLVRCDVKIEASASYKTFSQFEVSKPSEAIVGKRMRYRIKVYKCVGLKLQNKDEAPDVSVNVVFAGKAGSTTKRKLRECVEWNEQIIFTEMFPPLFHKLTVELMIGKNVIVSKPFYILEMFKYFKGGNQAIFGPNYVHLYNKLIYVGSLFMAIETDTSGIFKESGKHNGVLTLPTENISQQTQESFLCFGVLFDAMLNGRIWGGSNIQLSLNFGFTGHHATDESMNHPLTDHYKAVSGNSDFSYLPLNEQKPCVYIRSQWPDCTHRLLNTNSIFYLTNKFRGNLKYAEELILRDRTADAKLFIQSSVYEFQKECQKLSQMLMRGINDLEFGKVEFMSKFLNTKLPQLVSLCIKEDSLELVLDKLNVLINFVDELCEDVEECLPFIILSLCKNETMVGCSIVNPRHILFSNKVTKRGRDCGKIISLLLRSSSDKLAGRLDIWLWLGYWDEVAHCLKELPPGHEDLSKIVTLPPTVTYQNFERYMVFCRIYSGIIVGTSNFEGHCDVFVRVLCTNQSQQTKPEKRTMAPIWKESLVLSDIRLYPSPIYVKENPPLITVELWDEATNPPHQIGVELIKPSYITQIETKKEFKLDWLKVGNKSRILSSFEIIMMEAGSGDPFGIDKISSIVPTVIDPVTVLFRLEVVFWGIRPVDVTGLNQRITRVQAIIQCSSSELKSNIMIRNHSLNFQHDLHILPLELPSVHFFSPPMILRVISDHIYIGCFIERNVHRYEYKLPTKTEWNALYIQRKSLIDKAESRHSFRQVSMPDLIPLMEIDSRNQSLSNEDINCGFMLTLKNLFNRSKSFFTRTLNKVSVAMVQVDNIIEEEEYDWWFGYFSGDIKIYGNELENQKDFNGFNDVLQTYLIKERKKGKLIDVIKVKTLMCLYEWPSDKRLVTMEGQDPELGVLRLSEFRDRVKLLVRVYCIRAHNLNPSDPNGLADPFIEIATPSNKISDKSNYISKQLNPVFGRCLEIPATLPTDSILTVRVMDWDMLSASDLIGETIIDIENRFYSKHRATCGLPQMYAQTGYNTWRDTEKPTDILEKLCNTYNLPLPQYYEKSVLIGSKEFLLHKSPKIKDNINETLALMVLNRWSEVPIVGRPLVPQHVETRSLYIKDKPGLERGKLELWVDLFDQLSGDIPPTVDIRPRDPLLYELRVVILNTAKVPLVDDTFFVGKKHTDIFVKGWLWDSNDSQATDVHYTSIDGTGNFNWRFIFQFLYLKQEKRMVIYKKDFLNIGKSESKVPALLHLQVWDSDRISPDDFIGAMVLELCRMPRGSISVRTCNPKHYISPSNTVDLFKTKRLRGWWPFFQMSTNIEPKSAGFLEAEFYLLTKEEALLNPAGLGRAAPNALPAPLRPSIKIKFWLAPFRALFYYICGVHKGKVLLCGLVTAIVIFILVGIYSVPIFIIKRLLGA